MTAGIRVGTGRTWSLHQVGLAVTSTLGAALFLVALRFASGGFDGVTWLLVLGPLALLTVYDSAWPLGYCGVLVLAWVLTTQTGTFSWWSVPAAVGLLTCHSAMALSASAPPTAPVPARTLRRWAWRVGAAGLAAAGTAGAVTLLSGRVSGLGPIAYIAGLVAVAALLWVTRSNPPAARE